MKILIIEDDAGIRNLISETLTDLGFEVHSVDAFEDADTHLTNHLPDLMIVDYNLADSNANGWIKKRKAEALFVPPFIVSTGQGDERIAVEMMKLGAKDYLIKDTLLLDRLPPVIERITNELENEAKLKLAEKDLVQSEQKFRLMFENNPQPMLIYDLETLDLLQVNAAAIKQYGYSLEEFLEMTIEQLHTAEDLVEFNKMITATRLGFLTDKILRHKKKNGEVMYVEIFSSSIVANGRNARHVLMTDVTERIKYKNALEAKVDELLRFHKITIDRELKMIELKKEINELLNAAGKDDRYRIVG